MLDAKIGEEVGSCRKAPESCGSYHCSPGAQVSGRKLEQRWAQSVVALILVNREDSVGTCWEFQLLVSLNKQLKRYTQMVTSKVRIY